MKKGIHPTYYEDATVTCSNCGTVWHIGSTKKEFRVEVCANCHPFYTGQQQVILDVEGQVDRFNKRLQAREQYLNEQKSREEARTSLSKSLTELQLAPRAFDALQRAGISTIGDVIARLSAGDNALLAIEGFGRKSLIDLKRQLRQKGYQVPVPEGEASA